MMKIWIPVLVLCCAGCRTTRTDTPSGLPQPFERSEQLTVRVDQYVGTYDVIVNRQRKPDSASDTWETVFAHHVAGHPNKWLQAGSTAQVPGYSGQVLFWLDNATQQVALEPGINLAVRVKPKSANTVLLEGVYAQIAKTDRGLEELSVPFMLECVVGRSYVIYRKQVRFEGMRASEPES